MTQVSVGDVTVDMSHDILNALQVNPPVGVDENPADTYRHGAADGIRWLLDTLMVGSANPNEVPVTDDMLETLAGVMVLFGERGTMRATLTLKEV